MILKGRFFIDPIHKIIRDRLYKNIGIIIGNVDRQYMLPLFLFSKEMMF